MSHTNKTVRLSAKMFLLSIGLTLVACGGGGGGGNNIPPAAVKYTGPTSEASVTAATAEEITKAYIEANQENVGGLATGATTSQDQSPLDKRSKNILIEQLKQQVISSLNNKSSIVSGVGVVASGNCTINNVDGITNDGSITGTTYTDTNTEGSGKLSFNSVCLFDATENTYAILNGDIYYSARGNLQAGITDSIILNIPRLTVFFKDITTGNSFSETISEYISFIYEYDTNGNLIKLTLTMYSDIDVAGTVYRFEVIVVSGSLPSTTVKFYHPTYGSVTFVDALTNSGACGNLPDGGDFLILTSTNTYTITPSGTCDNNYTVAVTTVTPTAPAPATP